MAANEFSSIAKNSRERKSLGKSPRSRAKQGAQRVHRLAFETLEDRRLLAALPQLLKDINVGMDSSFPESFMQSGAQTYFLANSTELWKTDGTSGGTVLLKDLDSGTGHVQYLEELVDVNGTLAFGFVDTGTTMPSFFTLAPDRFVQLWKSDGTTSGTVLVKDFGMGSSAGGISEGAYLTNVNGTLFGAVSTPDEGNELWKSDLTEMGTALVKDIIPGSLGSEPQELFSFNGKLFFSANDGVNGRELWVSDGTSGGTVLLKDIKPENWTAGYSVGEPRASYPTGLTAFGGEFFFGVFDAGADGNPDTSDDNKVELWKSDGTTAGTVLVKDFGPGSSSYNPQLTAVNGTLFGVVGDAAHGRELWKTDGTNSGTVLVKDIGTGTLGSYPYLLTNVNGMLFFNAFHEDHGHELWKSDGTSMGTVLVKDIIPGPTASYPFSLANVNGILYFSAEDNANGRELWKSDGTSDGTVLVLDINPNSASSWPYLLANINGKLYFAADDGTNGIEPWILNSIESDKIGFHRGDRFYLDINGNGAWNNFAGGDASFRFGNVDDTPIVGDWNGDGFDNLGVHRGNLFYLDVNGNGVWDNFAGGDAVYKFGNDGDTPLIGDWNGDGIDNIGFHRDNRFYLDLNGNGVWDNFAGGDAFFTFGNVGDTPIAGDWNGDGTDNIGFHRDNRFYLDVNGNGTWNNFAGGDAFYTFGSVGDTPLIGDWDGDGTDNIGFHRGDLFYLDVNGNGTWNNFAGGDAFYRFGNSTDTGIAGKWKPLPEVPVPVALLAEGGPAQVEANSAPLTSADLTPIVVHASALWAAVGLSDAQLQTLSQVQVQIADLPGAMLGTASGITITLDATAVGYGWFVDETPTENEEFRVSDGLRLVAREDAAAYDRMDLLSVVLHELGHVLGYDHDDEFELLLDTLAVGVRRVL